MISTKYAIDLRLKRVETPSFDVYPFSLPAERYLDILEFHPAVTFMPVRPTACSASITRKPSMTR